MYTPYAGVIGKFRLKLRKFMTYKIEISSFFIFSGTKMSAVVKFEVNL